AERPLTPSAGFAGSSPLGEHLVRVDRLYRGRTTGWDEDRPPSTAMAWPFT
ncbi:MAG: hypothetical protein RL588_601, partial [Pseudomonadota bacterium]